MYLLLIIIAAVLVGWPVAILLAILGWADTGGMLLWPAAIVLGILWYRKRGPGRSAQGPRASDETWSGEIGATRALSLSDTIDLATLRLDLDRQHAAGTLPAERYAELCAAIDGLWMEQLRAVEAGPGSEGWCARRARAFYRLAASGLVAGGPPWVEAGRGRPETEPSIVVDGLPVLSASVAGEPPTASPGLPIVVPGTAVGTALLMDEPDARGSPGDRIPASAAGPMGYDSFPLPTAGGGETGVRIDAAISHARTTPGGDPAADRQIVQSHAFRPAEPGLLERTLRTVSGWHALIAPFLVQNIGWFIGGFCFVAGSVFLVSYTTGFGKAFAIWGAMLLYTVLLIGGGYGLRRRRPELRVSSEVLTVLGALLVPLTIAAATRLIATSPSFGFVVAALVAAALSLGLLYPVMLLASGVMDRRLAAHPRLFLALCATQLAVPILDVWRSWAGIALMHLVVFGFLCHALLRFTDEWLQAIFVERRKSAIYAAGTLIYAALVAFVHATWGAPEGVPLPQGYSGPFLMAAAGLLFYVDARLKHWSAGHAFLSRFTFAIYGLSVLALALAAGAPVARGVTLVLAIGLYGFVVWHYLTLTPLYFLLGCVSWLYALVVLRPFDPALHLLLALPGLAGLYALDRSLLARRSARLAEIASWTLGCALLSLAAWSLWNGEPGLTGFATGAAATGLWSVLIAIRAPARGDGGAGEGGGGERLARYGVLFFCAVTLAYSPHWSVVAWATQFSLGLVVLAALWTERGLAFLDARGVTRAAVLLDGGLLATALAVPVALGAWFWQGEPAALPAIVLVIAGALFSRQGLALHLRPLIYAALACFTAAGVLTKLTYFPEPSAGGLLMALATLSWVALLVLERAAVARRDPPELEAMDPLPVTLLWGVQVLRRSHGLRYERLLSAPITQAMVVLWLAGITHLVARLAEGRPGWAWVFSAGLGAMVGVLFAGRFRRAGLVAVSLVLGVGAWLAALHRLGFTTSESMLGALTAYALIAWAGSVWVLRQAVALRLAGTLRLCGGYGPEGGRVIIERTAHAAAMGLCLAGVVLAIGGLLDARVALDHDILPVPAIAAGFWCASAWRYRKRGHVYLMLAALILGVLIAYGRSVSTVGLWPLATDPGAGLALVLVALAFLVAAQAAEHPAGRARTLYPVPLAHTAVALGFVAAGLQVWDIALAQRIDGTLPSLVVALGGVVLLWANRRAMSFRLDLMGLMLLVLALLCAEIVVFHDGLAGTALTDPGLPDLWVTLAIVSLLLGLGADAVHRWPSWAGRLSEPLQVAAGLCYDSALLAGIALAMLGPSYRDPGFAWVMLALAVALPPLRWPIPMALLAPVRGLGVALFLSAALGSWLITHGLAAWLSVASLGWAYVLWSLAAFVVPAFNARWPRSALNAGTWPWLGLGFIAVGLMDVGAGPAALALRLLVASGYLFLLLGQSAWPGWTWGAVSGLAAAGGVSILALLDASMPTASVVEFLQWFLIGLLIWANVLLYAGRLWRRYGVGIASRMKWGGHDLAAPFTAAASLGLGLGFLALCACVWDALFLSFPRVRSGQAGFVILLSLTLALSRGHALRLSRTPLMMHGLVVALAGVWLGGYLMLGSSIVHPPLAVAGFALLVYTARAFRPPADPLARSVSLRWCGLATLMAIATLVVYWNVPVPERLLTLAMTIGLAGGLGVATGRHAWRMAALGMMIVFLHAWPLAFVPVDRVPLLLPWYALELALLALALQRHGWSSAAVGRSPRLDLAARSWPWLCGMAVIEWSLHLLALADALAAGSPPARLAGPWDGIAALIAAASILWIGLRRVRDVRQTPWTYAAFLWAGALGFYLRLLLLGLGPVSLWDTAALIVVAYGLVFLQRFFDSRTLLHLSYLMPLAVLMTVPLQLASVPASLGLVTAGSVYLLMRRTTETAPPLYLGVLALNAALYLWIPGVAREAGLIQVYLIPASLSVLILLHLHRREIKPSVAHSTRLGAVTLLYATATADVFLTPGLGVFALALGLSLVGAAFGIALRMRALLYAGVTFLIVNVLGQLVRFYPDGRLAKAVILMVAGAAITAAMVWFNLKREKVLSQVRVFRADLARWD